MRRVVLGFSGGVDSSVAAALLREAGWEVLCLYLETGSGEEAAARARDEHLADPNWKEEPVEPGDQDPNPPYREPAEGDGDDAPASASSTSDEAPVDAPAPQAPEQKGDGTER